MQINLKAKRLVSRGLVQCSSLSPPFPSGCTERARQRKRDRGDDIKSLSNRRRRETMGRHEFRDYMLLASEGVERGVCRGRDCWVSRSLRVEARGEAAGCGSIIEISSPSSSSHPPLSPLIHSQRINTFVFFPTYTLVPMRNKKGQSRPCTSSCEV